MCKMKKNKKELDPWIDIHDDELMISLGIRPPHLEERDPEVWTKTTQEKKLLRSLRNKHKGKMSPSVYDIKPIPVEDKLIIQLSKNKKFPNSTYSINCGMHQIGDVLRYFNVEDKSGNSINVVAKYTFNGKTYEPSERPFWF